MGIVKFQTRCMTICACQPDHDAFDQRAGRILDQDRYAGGVPSELTYPQLVKKMMKDNALTLKEIVGETDCD